MYISLASILVHVPASFGMMQLLSTVGVSPERPNGFGHAGVALATSVVATVNLAALLYYMRRKIKRINGRDVFAAFVKIMIASTAMSVAAYGSYYLLHGYFSGDKHFWIRMTEAFIPMALAGITFLIAAKLLRVGELEHLVGIVRRKLGK
jgi:peptidoglycan biosynthesis protein MviN/MurJ (putative lipid II flippase)